MKRSLLEEIHARWGASEEFLSKEHSDIELRTRIEQAYVDTAALFGELIQWEDLVQKIESTVALPGGLHFLDRTARVKELVEQFMRGRR